MPSARASRAKTATATGNPANPSDHQVCLGPPEPARELAAQPPPEAGPGRPGRGRACLDVEQGPGHLGLDGGEAAGHEGQHDQRRDHQWRDGQPQAQAPYGHQRGEPHRPEDQRREEVGQPAIRRRIDQGARDQFHLTSLRPYCSRGHFCRLLGTHGKGRPDRRLRQYSRPASLPPASWRGGDGARRGRDGGRPGRRMGGLADGRLGAGRRGSHPSLAPLPYMGRNTWLDFG